MFGQYAPFIIPAYAISFLALALAALVTWRVYRIRKAELERLTQNRKQNNS